MAASHLPSLASLEKDVKVVSKSFEVNEDWKFEISVVCVMGTRLFRTIEKDPEPITKIK